MDVFQNVDKTRDLPTDRPLGLAENDFRVKQRVDDPYGFWWISRDTGQVPEKLRGAYTKPDLAEEAVKAYLGAQ